MKTIVALCAAAILSLGATAASAQALIDKGFVSGWNVMVDPSFGNGCLIQTVTQDLSVVRIGYDVTGNRGYFVVFHKAWGDIEKGKTYDVTFDLDGQIYDAVATGFVQDRVPGAGVFFTDREFIHSIAQKKVMTVYNQAGEKVIAIDLKGSAKALDYARKCQAEQG
ncbi:hypothetical protein [Sedimentitalea todarodis]|uniref:Uncharacterized protein n=1 Tax=Sedimentitalea todarodis TaxID=1631240 RepID=A0ABU3VAC6_9RHOB|nr:hypothetical protein [Sedimentitalea todarodis]MDU9003131.1 hypothetical protein [Sedimentitalea todarodis]